jgi:glyoxylase-like metal-dependent hydrolase (beta-lactamase superfamily II)
MLRTSRLKFVVLAGLTVMGASVQAQQQKQPPSLSVRPIKEGAVYWLAGGGGNTGVVIGQTGVVIIDAKITPEFGKLVVSEVAKLTPKPITHVILTHSDGDHVNGLTGFPAGINIIAHENNRKEQQMTFLYAAVEVDGGRCLPPAERLPTQVIAQDNVATKIDGVNFVFRYFGPAHTSGDLVVYVPDYKIAFAGDLITSTVLVHTEKFGSLDGWFKNARGLLALDADTYVGGHADTVDTKATLQKRIDGYQAMKDKVDALMKENKSLADIKTAMSDPPKNPAGCRGIPYLSFAEVEYQAQMDKTQQIK